MEVQLQIRRDGQLSKVDLDLDIANLTAQESERIGDALTAEEREGGPSAKLFRALMWAKLLHTPYADVKFNEIDYDLSALKDFAETQEEHAWVADGDSVVIPMETTTGTVEAEVNVGR